MLVAETFGDLVAVEFDRAAAAQIGGAHAYCCFKRDQLTRFSSHRLTIRRYMLIVKPVGTDGDRRASHKSSILRGLTGGQAFFPTRSRIWMPYTRRCSRRSARSTRSGTSPPTKGPTAPGGMSR